MQLFCKYCRLESAENAHPACAEEISAFVYSGKKEPSCPGCGFVVKEFLKGSPIRCSNSALNCNHFWAQRALVSKSNLCTTLNPCDTCRQTILEQVTKCPNCNGGVENFVGQLVCETGSTICNHFYVSSARKECSVKQPCPECWQKILTKYLSGETL